MGSAALACPCLDAVARGPDAVVGVVTQPDRPKGRSLRPQPCPLKETAEQRSLVVLTPENINTPDSVAALRDLKPDVTVVVAYGQILKPSILEIPPCGCVNVHASLLPKYRGAAPIQWAVANGDLVTGVTTMYMDAHMDTGDIILQEETGIGRAETAGELHDRLAVIGAGLLRQTLDAIREGKIARTRQDPSAATYAAKLKKADGRIAWTQPARVIYNHVRGFNPWPCCFCEAPAGSGKWLRVLRSEVAGRQAGVAGTVVSVDGSGPVVATGEDGLRLTEVQPEGRTRMSGADYLRGHGLKAGDKLG